METVEMDNLLTRVYYMVKPLMTRRMQILLRRRIFQKKRRQVSQIWPIDEKAGRIPVDWKGWPCGKRFAFILTHDVESSKGLAKCIPLMNAEKKLGFRSSFNFVPEKYSASSELRDFLKNNGFEVGIHGLNHKGNMFSSRSRFVREAACINNYLKEWGSVGFRSPSMFHNLEWIRELNIEYDLSTFDTDPFEPQPTGVETIFPFLYGNDGETGQYVELPYTIPQDFTLFNILEERNIDVWKRKLEWIAERGGMALLDTHPDYMAFDGATPSFDEYPADFYTDFLRHVKERYKDLYWHVLPRDLARFVREGNHRRITKSIRDSETQPGKSKKVCMIAYSSYTYDARIKSYVKILNSKGIDVDLLVLKEEGHLDVEGNQQSRVFRLCNKYRGSNPVLYIFSYIRFFLSSFMKVSLLAAKERYSAIHVHNMPNFVVFASFLPKLLGSKVILDIHDLMPPIYMVKFNVGERHALVRFLEWEQGISARYASHVICADHLQKAALSQEYGIPEEKVTVVMNLPHEEVFKRIAKEKDPETFNLIYHGTIAKRLGIDLMLLAVSRIKDKIPVRLNVYGVGDFLDPVLVLQKRLGLQDVVHISGSAVPTEKLSEIICGMDVGIIANRRNPATDKFMMPVKLMEYAYLKIPVIAPRLTVIQYYFREDMLKYYEPENIDELSQCILDLYHNKDERQRLAENAVKFFDLYNARSKSRTYLQIIPSSVPSPVRQQIEI